MCRVTSEEYTRLSNTTENWVCTRTHLLSQDQYLHSGGWQTSALYQQEWAHGHMHQFQCKQNQWTNKKCTNCSEQWPPRTCATMDPHICDRCRKDKHHPKVFSSKNDMDPGNVPSCYDTN